MERDTLRPLAAFSHHWCIERPSAFSFKLSSSSFFSEINPEHLQPFEQRRYSRFTLVENTINFSPNVPRDSFLRSNRLFCFISICKFGSFKNSFGTITSHSELYFRLKRIIKLLQTKKVISMNYGAAQAGENHEDERGLN